MERFSSVRKGVSLFGRSVRVGALVASLLVSAFSPAVAEPLVRGGGSAATDCILYFDVPGANKPSPPKPPKHVDCDDGDPACDADGLRNGQCVFDVSLCVNSTAFSECMPTDTTFIFVDHAEDNGDRKFDVDFQALQQRANTLGLPTTSLNDCATQSSMTVRLRGPNSRNKMRTGKKKFRAEAEGFANGKESKDRDKIKFVCRAEGDKVYLPLDLYTGTFDRIRTQIFQQSCALSGCHDSEGQAGDLILLSSAAYGNTVGVAPDNVAASIDGLLRVTPGDEAASFLYRKILNDLETGYGSAMPLEGSSLSADLVELVRLWILGDGTLGPAPETGWVEGTDQ